MIDTVHISDLIDSKTGERRYLNREERQAFKEAAHYMPPDVKYYAMMLYYTGCRVSEALEVTPNRLDFEEMRVIFRTLKQVKTKPDKFRAVELPKEYLASLSGQYGAKNKRGKKKAGNARIWPFTKRTGQNYIKKIMAEAGITGLKSTGRGLRHSMGVMLALDKVPVNVIQGILGHSEIQNTLIYTQVIGEDRRQMIANVW